MKNNFLRDKIMKNFDIIGVLFNFDFAPNIIITKQNKDTILFIK